jgi:hypothetical protein
MSKSIHITSKNFNGLTKNELNEQSIDPASEINLWALKLRIKNETKKERKQNKL